MRKNILIDKLKTIIDSGEHEEYALIELNKRGIVDKITYPDLYNKIVELGEKLSALNLENRICVLYLPATIDSIILIYSCFYAGIIPIIKTVTNDLERERFFYQFHDLIHDIKEIDVVITNYQFDGFKEECLKDNIPYINVNELDNIDPFITKKTRIEADVIQLTSGTTSLSKAVLIKFEQLYMNLIYHIDFWEMSRKSVSLTWMPFSHSYGASTVMYIPFLLGATSYMMSPYDFKYDLVGWLQNISKYKITHAHASSPNFMLESSIKEFNKNPIELDLSHLEAITMGGEMINADMMLAFYETFKEYWLKYKTLSPEYGMSEGPGGITGTRPSEEPYIIEINEEMRKLNDKMALSFDKLVSVGRTNEYIHVMIPETFEELPENTIGEIVLTLPSLVDGYLNKEQNTNFIYKDGVKYYRTGDMGFVQNGYLILTGRIKDIIILNSKNISPLELENCIKNNLKEKYGEVIVFSIRYELSEKVVVYQEVNQNLTDRFVFDLKNKIKNIIKSKLNIDVDEDKILIVKPNTIPRTASGKLSRRECRELYLSEVKE